MRKLFFASLLVGLAACGGGGSDPVTTASISVSAGTSTLIVGQTTQATAVLKDSKGTTLTGRKVTWTSTNAGVAKVDSNGVITAVSVGSATITGSADGKSATVAVTVVANTSTTVSCTSGATLSVGDVRPLSGAERATLCINGTGSGSEYTVVAFNANQDPATSLPIEVSAANVGTVTGPPTPTLVPIATGAVSAPGVLGSRGVTFGSAWHADMLESQSREVMSRAAEARQVVRERRQSTIRSSVTGVPAVGDLLTITIGGNLSCSATPPKRVVRVEAISRRAIVVSDTANPTDPATQPFGSADYQRYAQAFDDLVYPLDSANFGPPSDIDNNGGRAILVFSRVVNELTPKSSTTGYIGGFFAGRDILPVAADPSQNYSGCKTSNEGEYFYLLIPDSTGTLSVAHKRSDVDRSTISTLAHEFQHLINFSRRVYVNDADVDEKVWLNEGLSHIAEELLFYREAAIPPRQNIDSLRLFQSQDILDAFNRDQAQNFGRLMSYLAAPESNSPYANDDKLETRGATWQFLRYAADRRGGDEKAFWFGLVNSKTAGFPNLTANISGDPTPYFRDWAIAQYTDDAVPNVAAIYTHPSWNYRTITPLFFRPRRPHPLVVRQVTAAGLAQTLVGGGASYLRFAIAANQVGGLAIRTAGQISPDAMNLYVVRTK